MLQAASYTVWGDNNCGDMPNQFDNKPSSIRYSGPPDGYKYDTLNFYSYEDFMGVEQYTYDDAPSFNFDNFGRYHTKVLTVLQEHSLNVYSID